MKLLDNLLSYLKKGGLESKDPPSGYCPNCWGREEYGGKFYKAVKKHQVDINTRDIDEGWVKEYAEKHLGPIHLKPTAENRTICSTCRLTYKEEA